MTITECSTKTKVTECSTKTKVTDVKIICELVGNKRYYSLRYVINNNIYVGYSSYNIDIVLGYIKEYFEIIPINK